MADLFFPLTIEGLIILLVIIWMAPFALLGVWNLIGWIDGIFKVRKGYIKIKKLLPNDQMIKLWVRPTGGKIRVRKQDSTGVTQYSEITVKLGKGWLYREGGIPFILLDKDNNQVPWEVNYVGSDVPKEVIDEIADTAFTAGMLLQIKQGKQLQFILYMLILLAAMMGVGIFLNYYLISTIHITTQTVNVMATNATQTVV